MAGYDVDDFWSIDKLLPKKKSSLTQFSTSEKTVSVYVEGEDGGGNKSENKLNFDLYKSGENTAVSAERSYHPEGSYLIKEVRIIPSLDKYDFYDTFRKAALIYFDYRSGRCDFTPFYSYKPQYSQMNTAQKKYYFYWRDEIRKKKYLKTDYSYVYLYAYEILNLPDKIEKKQGLSMLCDVWEAYRQDLPKIDFAFSAWVQDYCLIYGLPCPSDRISGFLFDVINASDLKEFYLTDKGLDNKSGISALIAYLSDYDWRRGKYAGGEHGADYRMHVEGAMNTVVESLIRNRSIISPDTVRVSRAAFPGSLCTHSVKCNIEIEYYPLAGVPEIREAVTAALKYTENKLRSMLGIKSRLATRGLPDDYKMIIDAYFSRIFERINKEKTKASIPEYERLYDAPKENISFEDASEIEKASWDVTARLVSGTEAEDVEPDGSGEVFGCREYKHQTEVPLTDEGNSTQTVKEGSEQETMDSYGTSYAEQKFISLLCRGKNSEAKAVAAECGMLPELLVEKINEAFADNFGDVIIEEYMGFYHIIEDYSEEILNWSLKITK